MPVLNQRWTKVQLRLIQTCLIDQQLLTYEEVAELTGRTKRAVINRAKRMRAQHLGSSVSCHRNAPRNQAAFHKRAEIYNRKSGVRWTPAEDERILSADRPPHDVDLAAELGRKPASIYSRRWYLVHRKGRTCHIPHGLPEQSSYRAAA